MGSGQTACMADILFHKQIQQSSVVCFSFDGFLLREICYGKGNGRTHQKKVGETRSRLVVLFWQPPKRTFLYARCNLSSMFGGWASRHCFGTREVSSVCGAEVGDPLGPSRAVAFMCLLFSKLFRSELGSARSCFCFFFSFGRGSTELCVCVCVGYEGV